VWPAHGPGGEADKRQAAKALKKFVSGSKTVAPTDEIVDLAGIDMLGTGYDAKQPCEFETCSKRKIVKFTYDLARRVRVMGKLYSIPDQITYEPIYHTTVMTHAWDSAPAVAKAFAEIGGAGDASATSDGFTGGVSARFSMANEDDSDYFQTYYGMRSIDVALYRLSLNFDSGGNAKILEGCADTEWGTKGKLVCSEESLLMADGTTVDLAQAKLCGRTYCTCIQNFVHDFCIQLAGLTIADSVEDDPRSFLAFTSSWGTSFVKSTRIGATLEVNMLIQEKKNTSDLYSFDRAKAAMEAEFSDGFSTTPDKDR
jgi:hypothetical protein